MDQQRSTFESCSLVYSARVARALFSIRIEPYWCHRTELTYFKGCIMWGAWVVVPARVVVPAQGCRKLLQELHIGHPGIYAG